eukprot:SAG31_NODE_335_length_17509_cov_7.127972_6_plen_181_part_00
MHTEKPAGAKLRKYCHPVGANRARTGERLGAAAYVLYCIYRRARGQVLLRRFVVDAILPCVGGVVADDRIPAGCFGLRRMPSHLWTWSTSWGGPLALQRINEASVRLVVHPLCYLYLQVLGPKRWLLWNGSRYVPTTLSVTTLDRRQRDAQAQEAADASAAAYPVRSNQTAGVTLCSYSV